MHTALNTGDDTISEEEWSESNSDEEEQKQ